MGKTGFFLVLLFFILVPAHGAALQCLAATDCPPCGIDGAVLTGSRLNSGFTDRQVLTCEYGSGNDNAGKVTLRIICFENAAVAREVTEYWAGTGENPSQSEYASLYGRPRWRCVSGGSTKGSGQTMIKPFGCTDFTGTGRFVATIDADGQAGYLSSDPAAEQSRKLAAAQEVVKTRIQKYKDCFAGFSPGTAPSPSEKPLHGTVVATDMPYGIPQPLKYAVVSYTRDDGKIDTTTTNDKGEYSFDGMFTPGKQYGINITLTYAQDKDYFTLGLYQNPGKGLDDIEKFLGNPDKSPDDFVPVSFTRDFTYRTDADLVQNISLDELYRQTGKPGRNPFGIMYVHHQEALEFYKDYLKEEITLNLPVKVYLFADQEWIKQFGPKETPRAFYRPGGIYYGNNKTVQENTEDQRRTVYHEFSHYMMDNLYGNWPEPRYGPGAPADRPLNKNHDGFLNPSSTDSLTEGFADFMPAVIQEYYGHGECGVTSWIAIRNGYYRPWMDNGADEELAFAGFLWDLYDSPEQLRECYIKAVAYQQKMASSPYTSPEVRNRYRDILIPIMNEVIRGNRFSDRDSISLGLPALWQHLRVYREDTSRVYAVLVQDQRIDRISLTNLSAHHGFWIDQDPGNATLDRGEPFRDTNDNRVLDAGEFYIDLPDGGMDWSAGLEQTGTASNYQRPWRLTTRQLPGHFVRVNNAVPYYFYTVEFPGTDDPPYLARTENENGLIYTPIPPNPAAKITIYAEGVGTARPLSYTSQEFYADYDRAVQQGYYISHDFGITGPVPTKAPVPDFGQGGTGGSGGSASGILAMLLSPTSHVPLYISVPVAAGALLLLGILLRKVL